MWVQAGSKMAKKGFLHTSHLSANPVLPKNEVPHNHSALSNTLSKLKYELTDPYKILRKFIFY